MGRGLKDLTGSKSFCKKAEPKFWTERKKRSNDLSRPLPRSNVVVVVIIVVVFAVVVIGVDDIVSSSS